MTTRSIGRAWVRLCAASLIGLSAPVATAAMLGMAPHAVSQVPTETPQQRCQRETQQYNQAQTAAWQAIHPGQPVPTPPPWPPYICVGGPHIDAGAPTGGTGGGATTDSRPDRWDGQSIAGNRQPGWSDTGVDVGAPRRGIARTPADPAAASALESARSNITQPVAQVTIDAGNDAPRQVIAAGDGPRRVVVDADGRTTGEVLVVDADGQARIIADGSVPAGIDADEAIADRPAGDHPAGGGAGILEQVGDDGVDVVAAEVTRHGYEAAAMAAGAAAAVAGALAAAAGSRPGRRVRTLPRVIPAAGAAGGGVPPTPWAGTSARFGWVQPDGDRQRFVVMADEDSARTHRFGMDVPDGGRMVANPDGSVDVVDADGRVVDHVKAPWAYDAAGRPVDTWYEVDNDTGELVQHVAPDESTVFPIIADPEQSRSTASKKSQSTVIDPKTRAAMDRAQTGKKAADKQKAASKPKSTTPPKPAPTRQAAPKETPQQQKANDAHRDQRQPGFVGPVTAEDKAGQQRNQQRIDNNKHAAASAGNNNPAKIPDTDTTKPVQAQPSTPRPTPPQQQHNESSPDEDLFLGQNSPYATGATEREINGPSTTRRGDIDALSPEGDHISRGADGRVNVHADDSTTVTSNRDGSTTVTDGGRTTTYYPTTRGDVTDTMQIESSTYDADSNETRQVFIKPDGSRVEQRRPGKQQVNGPVNSRVQHTPVATPEQPVADIDYRQPTGGAQHGQIEVHHRGAEPGHGTIDVVPADGQPVTVNAETGAVDHLGTTDNPVQGPFKPAFYDPNTGELGDKKPEPGDFTWPKTHPAVSPGLSGLSGAADALETAESGMGTGKHGKPYIPGDASKIVKGAGKVASPVGDVIGIYNVATAENKTEQASKEVGSFVGAKAGAATLGTVGFMFAGPPGAALGGLVGGAAGSFIGEKAGGTIYDMTAGDD